MSEEVEAVKHERSVFWDDIAEDMKNPAFWREYAKVSKILADSPKLIHKGRKP